MPKAVASCGGVAIETNDVGFGTVCRFLFDYGTRTARWMVVAIGRWLTGRKVPLRPSTVVSVEHAARKISVPLTEAQVEESSDVSACHLTYGQVAFPQSVGNRKTAELGREAWPRRE